MRVALEAGDIARWEDEVTVANLFDHPGGATVAGPPWIEPGPDSPRKECLPRGAAGVDLRLLRHLLSDVPPTG